MGRLLYQKGDALRSEICALRRETRESSLALPPCGDTPRGRLAVSQGGRSRHWAPSAPCLGPPSRRTARGDFVTAAHMGMAMWRHD